MRDRIFGSIFIVAMLVPRHRVDRCAIVIMNIMLSRSRAHEEIGIRNRWAARKIDILKQFWSKQLRWHYWWRHPHCPGMDYRAYRYGGFLSHIPVIVAILGALAASGARGLSRIVPCLEGCEA